MAPSVASQRLPHATTSVRRHLGTKGTTGMFRTRRVGGSPISNCVINLQVDKPKVLTAQLS